MSTSLDDLADDFRPLVEQLLAESAAAGVPLRVIQTLRSDVEQAAAVASGRSAVTKGKHQADADGKARAVDVCPLALLSKPNWAPQDPLWWQVGQIGEALGMRWGGRWRQPHDCPHFESIDNDHEAQRAERERASGVQWDQ